LLICYLIGSPGTIESVFLAAACIAITVPVVCRRRRQANVIRPAKCELDVDLAHKIRSAVEIEKNNYRSFINGKSSTNPANFVKILPVDVGIIGLTEISKIFFLNNSTT